MTIVLLALCVAGSVSAQTHDAQRIHGRVTDAATGLPVAWTLVRVCGLDTVPIERSTPAAADCDSRLQQLTDSLGLFDFGRLTAGHHEISAIHPGYRPLTVTVEVPVSLALGLALQLAPIPLPGVHVSSAAARVAASGSPGAQAQSAGAPRLAGSSDFAQDAVVHFLTPASTEAPASPVGGDVLRVLRTDAGVDAADDYTTRLWVRGGDWPETRVYFDGVPLFDPVQAAGVFAALWLPGGGVAVLHGGLQPVERPGAASAVLEVATAPAGRTGFLVEAAPDSWALSASGRSGATGAALGARTVSLATLSERTLRLSRDTTAEFPFAARDFTMRGDVQLSPRLRLEVSGHGAESEVTARDPPLSGARARTLSLAARFGLVHTAPHVNTSLQFGASDYAGRIDWPRASVRDTTDPVWGRPPTPQLDQRVRLQQVTAELSGTGIRSWRAGAALSRQEIEYAGPVPLPAVLGASHSLGSTAYRTAAARGAAWFNGVLPLAESVRARAAVRSTLDRATGARLEPRVAIQWQPRSVVSIELSAARHTQYEQSLGWAGAQIGPRLESVLLMLPAGGSIPVLQANLLGAALDVRASERTSMRARLYRRTVSGHIMRSPVPGRIALSTPRPGEALPEGWTGASGAAAGMELTAGRTSRSYEVVLAYTLSRSQLTADGVRFYSSADRRHSLDAALTMRPLPPLQVGLRVDAGSGSPFTRFFADGCEPGCSERFGTVGPAGAGRTPGYMRLDATASVRTDAGPVHVVLGTGVVNVLGRANALIYTGTRDGTDQFADGWPRSLSLFVRASL